MRCNIYYLAEKIELNSLRDFLKKRHEHLTFKEKVGIRTLPSGLIFYFPNGIVIIWGFSNLENEHIVTEITPFLVHPVKKITESLSYSIGKGSTEIKDDHIHLETKDPSLWLSLSFALAQSIQLSQFEEIIQKTVEKTKYIPRSLAQKGKISLSAAELAKFRGKIFMERSYINLHFNFLDSPEFLWENPEYEKYYQKFSKYLEIKERSDILNKKLDVLHDIFEVLSDEQKHRHSSLLEWIIIVLIAVEFAYMIWTGI
jgi:uncharacterized Rmd1/YagE family protein